MDICKFEKGLSKIYKVNRKNFEEATNKDRRYIKPDKKGKNQYYGYCPECDNPIVLVNLFVTQEKNGKPIKIYGKHSVEGNPFDSFDSLKYERCPLRNKNRVPFSGGEKHSDDELAEKIKDTIINNACKIKYFISKVMGIEVSPKLFILLIKEFNKSQGYYYKGLTKGNLPYLILYLSHQKSIEWQYIKKGCKESKEVEEKSKYFIISENRQILLKKKYKNERYKPTIVTVFKDHSYNTNNEQSFIYQIFEKFNKKEYLLYRQKIDFDMSYFYNLLNFEAKDKKCEIEEEVRKILKQ